MPNIKSTDTRHGTMFYYSNDRFIGHALERYGEYSEAEPELWAKFIKAGDHVIDVGANIGCFTLALADLVGPSGNVYAVEPQPETFDLLKRNTSDRANISVD